MNAKHPLPAVIDDKVYLIAVMEGITALDGKDLSLQLKSEKYKPVKGISVTPEAIFIENEDGKSYLLDKETLEEKKELLDGICFTKSSTCINGVCYTLRKMGEGVIAPTVLAALSCDDWQVLWEFKPRKSILGFAVTTDQLVLVDHRGSIYCLDPLSGSVLWDKTVDELGVLSADELEHAGGLKLSDHPHIHNDTVSIAYLYNYVIGLELRSGDLKWKRKYDDVIPYTTVTDSGLVYVYTPHNQSQCSTISVICSNTGSIKSEIQVKNDANPDERFDGMAFTDVTESHFWTLSYQGTISAINLESGVIDWEYEIKDHVTHNPFFISNNRLYVSTKSELSLFESDA